MADRCQSPEAGAWLGVEVLVYLVEVPSSKLKRKKKKNELWTMSEHSIYLYVYFKKDCCLLCWCMFWLDVCKGTTCVSGAHIDQKSILDLLELKLWSSVSCSMGAGIKLESSRRAEVPFLPGLSSPYLSIAYLCSWILPARLLPGLTGTWLESLLWVHVMVLKEFSKSVLNRCSSRRGFLGQQRDLLSPLPGKVVGKRLLKIVCVWVCMCVSHAYRCPRG